MGDADVQNVLNLLSRYFTIVTDNTAITQLLNAHAANAGGRLLRWSNNSSRNDSAGYSPHEAIQTQEKAELRLLQEKKKLLPVIFFIATWARDVWTPSAGHFCFAFREILFLEITTKLGKMHGSIPPQVFGRKIIDFGGN